MAGVLRLRQLPLVRHVKRATELLFSRYLLVTNTSITVGLGCTGDVLQQHYERFRGRQGHLDRIRTSQVFLTGFVVGPTCHFWYRFLDRILPGRTMRVVLRKVLIDQLVFSPVNIGIFLVMISYLNGRSGAGIVHDLRDKGLDLLKAEWIVWPPAQLVNFLFVPSRFRVLYDNSVSLGFDSYYSYVTFSRDRHRDLQRLILEGSGEGAEDLDYFQNTADELEDEMWDKKLAPTEILQYTCRIARYHSC